MGEAARERRSTHVLAVVTGAVIGVRCFMRGRKRQRMILAFLSFYARAVLFVNRRRGPVPGVGASMLKISSCRLAAAGEMEVRPSKETRILNLTGAEKEGCCLLLVYMLSYNYLLPKSIRAVSVPSQMPMSSCGGSGTTQ
jgi:hypothetical protein